VEGFEIQWLLTQCLKENICLQDINIIGNNEFTALVHQRDWGKLSAAAENRYRLVILGEKGIRPHGVRLLKRPITIVGIVLFVFIIFMQASFVSEIRVYGYEKITEREILEHLSNAGLFVGCSRSIDLDYIEIKMFQSLDNISWIGIVMKGGLAEVTIAEGSEPVENTNNDLPCNVVAKKEGYIEKVIAREGKESVVKGDFVNVGDIVISGIISIDDKTYTRDPENPAFTYVHADGQVYAKTIHRYTCFQERYEIEKRKTGKSIAGIGVRFGNFNWESSHIYNSYAASSYKEKSIVKMLWPFPVELTINKADELELYRSEKEEDDITALANIQIREYIKKNISDSAQILNKSLNFSSRENIIKVVILLEVLEEIGEKKPIPSQVDYLEFLPAE
jgi:similar to stage IV sporulation protein